MYTFRNRVFLALSLCAGKPPDSFAEIIVSKRLIQFSSAFSESDSEFINRRILLDLKIRYKNLVSMNQKTVKLLKKYADLKGLNEDDLKKEWMSLGQHEKSSKRQEILSSFLKK